MECEKDRGQEYVLFWVFMLALALSLACLRAPSPVVVCRSLSVIYLRLIERRREKRKKWNAKTEEFPRNQSFGKNFSHNVFEHFLNTTSPYLTCVTTVRATLHLHSSLLLTFAAYCFILSCQLPGLHCIEFSTFTNR